MISRPIVEHDTRAGVYQLHLTSAALGALGAVTETTFTATAPCPAGLRLDLVHAAITTAAVLTGDGGSWQVLADVGVVGTTDAIAAGAISLGGQGSGAGDASHLAVVPLGATAPALVAGDDLGTRTLAVRVYLSAGAIGAGATFMDISALDALVEILATSRVITTIPPT